MKRFILFQVLLLGTASCQFDVAGLPPTGIASDGAVVDAAISADAPPAADACIAGCVGDDLQLCEPAPEIQPCPLGCDTVAGACHTLVPSNGATADFLVGVTDALDVPAGDTVIYSDDGRIVVDGVEVRESGTGVRGGINYVIVTDDIGLLGVTSMTVAEAANVRVYGDRALIILSQGEVLVAGVIDVSAGCEAGNNICGGPGGGDGSNNSGIAAGGCAPGGNGTGGGGWGEEETGGGGGSFGSAGGDGGDADGDSPGGAGGALPGSCPGPELVPLVGGSGGGAGGIGGDGGDSGGGGGALQITSFVKISIIGVPGGDPVGIRASGAGGRGGQNSDGGGGGGAGGAILLEAPALVLETATLAANGGGGGGGGDDPDGRRGEDGPFGIDQALGGGGGNPGGMGASILGDATTGGGGSDDTGGGGGGIGVLRFNVPASGYDEGDRLTFSPLHTRADPVIQ